MSVRQEVSVIIGVCHFREQNYSTCFGWILMCWSWTGNVKGVHEEGTWLVQCMICHCWSQCFDTVLEDAA